MSKIDKLLKRLCSKPTDFDFSEAEKVMRHFGYEVSNRGRTSGSAVAFIHEETKDILMLHKPHPKSVLKRYQVQNLINDLKERGLIES